jgi:hypothetical protein
VYVRCSSPARFRARSNDLREKLRRPNLRSGWVRSAGRGARRGAHTAARVDVGMTAKAICPLRILTQNLTKTKASSKKLP